MSKFDLKSIELVLSWSYFGWLKDDTCLRYGPFYSCKSLSSPCVNCIRLIWWRWRRRIDLKIVFSSYFPVTSRLHWTRVFTCILYEDLESSWSTCQGFSHERRYIRWCLENPWYYNLVVWVETTIETRIFRIKNDTSSWSIIGSLYCALGRSWSIWNNILRKIDSKLWVEI